MGTAVGFASKIQSASKFAYDPPSDLGGISTSRLDTNRPLLDDPSSLHKSPISQLSTT